MVFSINMIKKVRYHAKKSYTKASSSKNLDNSLASGEISTIFLMIFLVLLYRMIANSISERYSTMLQILICLNFCWIFRVKSVKSNNPRTQVNKWPRMLSSVQWNIGLTDKRWGDLMYLNARSTVYCWRYNQTSSSGFMVGWLDKK